MFWDSISRLREFRLNILPGAIAWSPCLESGKGSRLFNAVYWAAATMGPIGVEDTRFTLPF